jgi:hypothetical protein
MQPNRNARKETTMTIRTSTPLVASLALATLLSAFGASAASMPGQHASFLHALTDLRHAQWNLTHRPGNAAVNEQERIAAAEIDRAIAEVMQAAGDNGQNVAQEEHVDATLDEPGALHHAQDLLEQARQDVSLQEDNPRARRLRNHAIAHIDRALQATRRAIRDVEHGQR